jgi:hypothetical protein
MIHVQGWWSLLLSSFTAKDLHPSLHGMLNRLSLCRLKDEDFRTEKSGRAVQTQNCHDIALRGSSMSQWQSHIKQ